MNALGDIQAVPVTRPGSSAVAAMAVTVLLVAGCSSFQAVATGLRTAVVGEEGGPARGTIALQPLAPVRRDIYTRSYRLGDTYTVRTGETVVSIKNYSITEKVGHATVLHDFAQSCGLGFFGRDSGACEDSPLSAVRGAMGNVFDVVAAVTLEDGQYFAVAPPSDGRSQVYLLVDPTGRLRRGAYVAWREELSPGMTLGRVPVVEFSPGHALSSQEPLFSFESVEKFVFLGPGYLSFDLVFTGTRDTVRGELVTFDYREYGRDSTDKPAFQRLLQFPASHPIVEVDKLRIEVVPVGYEQLRFRVIADGQPPPTTR